MLSSRLATLHDLKTVYDSEDLWDLYEIAAIKLANESIENGGY